MRIGMDAAHVASGESPLSLPERAIAELCRRYRVRKLALFGSVLRDDFTPGSDVDVLIEFEPEEVVGFRLFEIEAELEGLIGRKIDLATPGFLSRAVQNEVARTGKVIYEAA